MNTLKSMFGGGGTKGGKNSVEMIGFPDNKDGSDEESAGLIRGADPTLGSSGGRVSEWMDKFETGPDYTVAFCFLLFSILFFGMAVTSLPWIIISPKKFNLYFVFGSLFLQVSMAFYNGPVAYLRKIFSGNNCYIMVLYFASLFVNLYMLWEGTGYIMALVMIAV